MSGKDLPVLVAYDRKSKSALAHPVPHKGLTRDGKVDDYPVRVLVRDLGRLTYKNVDGKIEQDNALLAVFDAVAVMRKGGLHPRESSGGRAGIQLQCGASSADRARARPHVERAC